MDGIPIGVGLSGSGRVSGDEISILGTVGDLSGEPFGGVGSSRLSLDIRVSYNSSDVDQVEEGLGCNA